MHKRLLSAARAKSGRLRINHRNAHLRGTTGPWLTDNGDLGRMRRSGVYWNMVRLSEPDTRVIMWCGTDLTQD